MKKNKEKQEAAALLCGSRVCSSVSAAFLPKGTAGPAAVGCFMGHCQQVIYLVGSRLLLES